jgi:MYXO-CTERM domain-containing protein
MDLAQASDADAGSISGVTTWGVASTRFDLGPAPDPTQVGAVLYAVDGSGNLSLPSTQACETVTAETGGSSDSAGDTSPATASGCACSTTAAGERGAPAGALLLGLGMALSRRRRGARGGNL